MLYLVFDTNIWLYLANGYDPVTDKSDQRHDNLHFKLLEELKALSEKGDICILVNEIIFEEWRRNKERCKLKIQILTKKLSDSGNVLKDVKRYIKSNIEGIQNEYIDGIKNDIEANEKHIKKVEYFLFNGCKNVEISNDLKISVFNLSVRKKAPFHNKKNNIADASILLNVAFFLKNECHSEYSSAIFVSNNTEDFTDGKNKEDFHPDIKELLTGIYIKFERVLPAALKLSKEILLQIESYNAYERYLEAVTFFCKMPYCEESRDIAPWGYLDKEAPAIFRSEEKSNPNQTALFTGLSQVKKERKFVNFGYCVVC